MNIVAVLLQDHSALLKAAKAMCQAQEPSAARAHYVSLKQLLIAHSRAEESVVYTDLDKLGIEKLREATQEGEVEHSLCDHLVERLARGRADSALWKARATVLYELLEHHLEEENKEMLPLLSKHHDADHLEALARRFESRKQALMRT